jgi:hypothetical protein
MVAGGGQAGVGVDPAFYEVTSAGPVPAGGTARSKVSGTAVGRDMRFGVTSGRFRTLSPRAGTHRGISYACGFGPADGAREPGSQRVHSGAGAELACSFGRRRRARPPPTLAIHIRRSSVVLEAQQRAACDGVASAGWTGEDNDGIGMVSPHGG